MIKKILSFILIICLLLCMVACSKNGSDNEETNTPIESTIPITTETVIPSDSTDPTIDLESDQDVQNTEPETEPSLMPSDQPSKTPQYTHKLHLLNNDELNELQGHISRLVRYSGKSQKTLLNRIVVDNNLYIQHITRTENGFNKYWVKASVPVGYTIVDETGYAREAQTSVLVHDDNDNAFIITTDKDGNTNTTVDLKCKVNEYISHIMDDYSQCIYVIFNRQEKSYINVLIPNNNGSYEYKETLDAYGFIKNGQQQTKVRIENILYNDSDGKLYSLDGEKLYFADFPYTFNEHQCLTVPGDGLTNVKRVFDYSTGPVIVDNQNNITLYNCAKDGYVFNKPTFTKITSVNSLNKEEIVDVIVNDDTENAGIIVVTNQHIYYSKINIYQSPTNIYDCHTEWDTIDLKVVANISDIANNIVDIALSLSNDNDSGVIILMDDGYLYHCN